MVELDDSPATSKGTKFSVLQEVCFPVLGHTWLATAGPLMSVTVLFAKLAKGQCGRNVFEQLHSDENMKIMHINFRFFIRLDCHHCYGGSDLLRASNSPELKSFLLNICMEAPESITNCNSSGLFEEGAGIRTYLVSPFLSL